MPGSNAAQRKNGSSLLFRMIVLVIFLELMIPGVAAADTASSLLWEAAFEKYDDTRAFDIVQTEDGGFIVAGFTVHPQEDAYLVPSSFYQAYLVRVDGTGNAVWEKTTDDEKTRTVQSIIRTRNGEYLVAGTTSSPPTHDADAYLAKIDGNGTVLWERAYGGDRYDAANDVREVEGGGFVVAGLTTAMSPYDNIDTYLIRTDDAGNVLWERTYGGPYYDEGRSVRETQDGGFIVAGTGESDLIKTDSEGILEWNRSFGQPSSPESESLVSLESARVISEGGYILAGSVLSKTGDAVSSSGILIKTDADRNPLWTATFPGQGASWFYSVEPTANGDYIAIGSTVKSPDLMLMSGSSSIFLVRTDSQGNAIQKWSFNKEQYNEGRAAIPFENGDVVIAGTVTYLNEDASAASPDSWSSSVFVAKFSATGAGATPAGESVPLVHAPILAIPVYLFIRTRKR